MLPFNQDWLLYPERFVYGLSLGETNAAQQLCHTPTLFTPGVPWTFPFRSRGMPCGRPWPRRLRPPGERWTRLMTLAGVWQ